MEKFPKKALPAFLNFLQAKYDAYAGAVEVASTPYYAMIDPCDICQLRCPTCPTGIENEGKRSKIDSDTHYRGDRSRLAPELFDALMEESGENLFLIDFHSWGEPLLNEHTADFVRKAKSYDIITSIHTNLSLKLSDERIEELLSAGLDNLICSVDGFTQEVYERFRVGGDVELVKENLVRAAAIRDRLGLHTAIVYKYLVFSWNEHEIAAAEKFAQDHGIIFLRNDSCVHDAEWLPSYRKDEEPFLSLVDVEELDRQWERAGQPGYWREHEKHPFYLPVSPGQNWVPTEGPKTDTFCGWHYSVAVVQPGGQLAPCCMVEKERDRFGTVVPGETPLAQVWNNENYRKSRAVFAGQSIQELEDVDTICTRCFYPDALKHNYSNGDQKAIWQYLELYGGSEPVLEQAFRLLLDGEGEAARQAYITFFENSVAEVLEKIRDGRLEVALGPVSSPSMAAPEPQGMTVEQAAEVAQTYLSELTRIGLDGQQVHDASVLPHAKDKIADALLLLIRATKEEEARSTFINGAMVLAFFQPDVGGATGLDQVGPGQRTWQEVVNQEMHTQAVAFAEAGSESAAEAVTQ